MCTVRGRAGSNGARTNQETEEGARGSNAARQANCHDVARARGLSRCAETACGALSTVYEGETGSSGRRLLWPTCGPRRERTGRAEMSGEQKGCEGQGLPSSEVHVELHGAGLAQLSRGSRRDCPEASNHSVGRSATNVIFTRSIAGLTAVLCERSFGNRLRFSNRFIGEINLTSRAGRCYYKCRRGL